VTPQLAINYLWFFWALTWFAAAFWSDRSAKRPTFGAEILYRVVTLPRLIAGAVSSDRFTTLLLLGFAILALVLSGVGVFGVISSDVGQRRREMAVRRALGALPTSLAAMLVRQALLRASLGVGVGAVLGLVLALSMRSLLFGVSPGDPWTFVGVSIGVEGVVVGATLLCAIPAVRRSPLATLREG